MAGIELNHRAQGSLEYLLLLAAAIMIASVVVVTVTSSTSNTQTMVSQKVCDFMTSIGIQCGLSVSCSNDGPKLQGSTFNLSSNPVGGKSPYSYSWSGSGCSIITSSSAQSPLLSCSTAGDYTYTVTVTDSSSPANQKTCSTTVSAQLPAPTGLAATAGDRQVALGWDAVSGATKYKLDVSGGYTAVIDPIASTSYTDTGLTNGITYAYKVAACNASVCSDWSSAVSATPGVPVAITGVSIRDGAAYHAGPGAWGDCSSSATGTEVNSQTLTFGTSEERKFCAYLTYSDGSSRSLNGTLASPEFQNSVDGSLRWSANNTGAGNLNTVPANYGVFTSISARPSADKVTAVTYTYKPTASQTYSATFSVKVPVVPVTLTKVSITDGAAYAPGALNCSSTMTGTEVNDATITMSPSQTKQFCAYAVYSDGSSQNLNYDTSRNYTFTNYDGTLRWSSNNSDAGNLSDTPSDYGKFVSISATPATTKTTAITYTYKPDASTTKTSTFSAQVLGTGGGGVTPTGTGGTCVGSGTYAMCVEVNRGGQNCVTVGTYNLCVEVNRGGQSCVTSGNYSLCVKANQG